MTSAHAEWVSMQQDEGLLVNVNDKRLEKSFKDAIEETVMGFVGGDDIVQ